MPPQLGCAGAKRPGQGDTDRFGPGRPVVSGRNNFAQTGATKPSSATRSRWLARLTPRPKRPCFPATESSCPAGYEPLRHNRPTIPFLEPIRLGGLAGTPGLPSNVEGGRVTRWSRTTTGGVLAIWMKWSRTCWAVRTSSGEVTYRRLAAMPANSVCTGRPRD